jgi:hypothetical protein
LDDHIGQRETREVLAHVISHVSPDTEQHALALMIAGPVLVGLAKITGRNGAIYRSHDLGEGDRLGGTGEHVSASDPTF